MPIRSKAQWGMMAVKHPELLHRWQEEAPVRYAGLPEHAKDAEGGSTEAEIRRIARERLARMQKGAG